MSELNSTKKTIEKDIQKTFIKWLIITCIIALIFTIILFSINKDLGLVGLVFSLIFIVPIILKLYSVRSNKDIKYKNSSDNK